MAASFPAPDGVALTDLSTIGCAEDDLADEGELTDAWSGNDSGVYYIRSVGDCVWWFRTEVREIEPGATAYRGFANVASGRIVGTQLDLEWADVPLGDTVNGGGLEFHLRPRAERVGAGEATRRRHPVRRHGSHSHPA